MTTPTNHGLHLADRMRQISAFRVMQLQAVARALESQGRDIIHMEVGEPDFLTPAPVVAAATAAIAAGHHHYTPAAGLPALREAIAAWYGATHGVTVPTSRILVTPGASGALFVALALLVNPGDNLLSADPGYPCNGNMLALLEAGLCRIPVTRDDNYQLTPAAVEKYWNGRTAGVLLASPSNPTGTVIDPDILRAIANRVSAKGGQLIVDEIYQGLVYENHSATVLQSAPDAFVINSFSKYFGMTGWRVGWCVLPEAAIEPAERLLQNLYIAAPTVAQHAAVAAFLPETQAILQSRVDAFARRGAVLSEGLQSLGIDKVSKPQGAFYLYADIGHLTEDSEHFCHALLQQEGVAITPGTDFDYHAGRRHVRFAYTCDEARIAEAMSRIRRFIARRD